MAVTFKAFHRVEFEKEMWTRLRRCGGGFMKDITYDWQREGNFTREYIYSITTKNRAVDIIIFSSIMYDGNFSRAKGMDAVRVVLRWKTKNGSLYKKIHKHLRVGTLFENLVSTIVSTQKQVFDLDPKMFYKAVKWD